MIWALSIFCIFSIGYLVSLQVNHPLKEWAIHNDTRYLNLNVDCENCGKREWKYSPGGYYLSKRICMNCGLIQEASSSPFLMIWDQEEQAWFTEGFVDDPVKLVQNWEEKHRKGREDTLKRIAEKESKTKLFKADDIDKKGLFFTPHDVILKVGNSKEEP